MADVEPRERHTSRLLVIDPDDRLLLFRATSSAGTWFWFAPGGGMEEGETYEDTARRELWEETGLHLAVAPEACVWRRDFLLAEPDPMFGSGPVRFLERYFAVRVREAFEPTPALKTRYEEYMNEPGWFRWWSLEELAASEGYERFVPRGLAALLPPILGGTFPAAPILLDG